jgi:AcrR family transcriptional regulator
VTDVSDRSARADRNGPRWLDRHSERPVRIPLTLRRIVDAAIALVDAEGLGALTIRRLAKALGVAPMSLYSHVRDKAELVDVMVDDVISEVVESDVTTGPSDWAAELRALSLRYHAAWSAHQGLVRVYADGVTLGPNGTLMTERFLGILRDAGFTDERAVQAFWLLYHYTIGSLQIAPPRPTPGRLKRESTHEGRLLDTYFSAVHVDEIPHIVAVVDSLAAGGDYQFGLDVIVAGLQAMREREDALEETAGAVPALSPREAQVLSLVREGSSDDAVADELGITPRTVRRHIASLLVKVGAADREALAAGSAG